MKITLNGEDAELPANATVADLLRHIKLDAAPCAVEVNRQLVPRRRHAESPLREGDRVEVVTLVGGG